jgi:hypothetical protein
VLSLHFRASGDGVHAAAAANPRVAQHQSGYANAEIVYRGRVLGRLLPLNASSTPKPLSRHAGSSRSNPRAPAGVSTLSEWELYRPLSGERLRLET